MLIWAALRLTGETLFVVQPGQVECVHRILCTIRLMRQPATGVSTRCENVWAESEKESNPTSGLWIVWINLGPRTGNDLSDHGVAFQVVLLARKGWSSI